MARDDTPQLASTAWGKTPVVAKTARGRELIRVQAEAKRQAVARRERVLKHDWAQKRLRQIFGYKSATQWNGYVPPRADPLPDSGHQVAKPNTSPFRAALMQLMREVEHFDQTGELPEYAIESADSEDAE